MTDCKYNLLTEALIRINPNRKLTLPGLMTALARDEVDSYPALRPHQAPFLHMFLVQLTALALHSAEQADFPENETEWAGILRRLTPNFKDDAPWCLVVSSWDKPAFLQPAIPKATELKNEALAADAIDLLITSKNHDLKQAVAWEGMADDWLFALIALQTGEGFSGRNNYGIARMNGGSSSRPMLSLAPLSNPATSSRSMIPRPGVWWRRDVSILLKTRTDELARFQSLEYKPKDGLGLTWLAPWPEGHQLALKDLDIWFIEVCRRIRLEIQNDRLSGKIGASSKERINAKTMSGALGDPYAPIHKTENEGLTLAAREFDYRLLSKLLFSGDWELPILCRPASHESLNETMLLAAQALARGNCRTDGYKSRFLPVGGKIVWSFVPQRETLHKLAQEQMTIIKGFDKALSYALALVAATGESGKIKKDHYAHTTTARKNLDRFADTIFFEYLWKRFDSNNKDEMAAQIERQAFTQKLWEQTQAIFDQCLPAIPCPSFFRLRAETRARSALYGIARKNYPELFSQKKPYENQEADNAHP